MKGNNIQDALSTVYTRLLVRSRSISQTVILFVTRPPEPQAIRNAQKLLESGKQLIIIGIGKLLRKDFLSMVKSKEDVIILQVQDHVKHH